jgi:hypothetical protein
VFAYFAWGVSLPPQIVAHMLLGCAPGFQTYAWNAPVFEFVTVKPTTKLRRFAYYDLETSLPIFGSPHFPHISLLFTSHRTINTMTVGFLPGLPLTCLKTADFKSTGDVMKGKPTIIGKFDFQIYKFHLYIFQSSLRQVSLLTIVLAVINSS